jgi:transcriptional regulator with XRE-family HTH domain
MPTMPTPARALREILALATLRHRMPLTQGELAAAAGVSVGTVRGIERGAYTTVRPRVIRALAEALGVEPDTIAEFRPSLGLPLPAPDERLDSTPGRTPSRTA